MHMSCFTVLARRVARLSAALAAAFLVGGCTVELQNTRPAQDLEQQAKAPGSVYIGWRVFQDKCAGCHGSTANGGPGAPDLLPIVRTMGSRQFVGLVLTRYDWGLPVAPAGSERAMREARVDSILLRTDAPMSMRAWGTEPLVNAHLIDLYAYVSARAQGTQGPERPVP